MFENLDNSHVILATIASVAGFILKAYFPGMPPMPAVPVNPPIPAPAPSTLELRVEALERQIAALIQALQNRPATPLVTP